MDVRGSRNPLVVASTRRLAALNARYPWSHNDHFHGWILRRVPPGARRALDVGCGLGALVDRLSGRLPEVVGIDADAAMAAASGARFADRSGVEIRHVPFERFAAEGPGPFDAVTMVAVLHHLDLEGTLRAVPALLRPGGRLLVVGLAPVASPADVAFDLASAVLNPVVGMAKSSRAGREVSGPLGFAPVRDPRVSFDEIRAVARRVLPGARLRRRLFFRHTLEWTKPA